MSNNRVVTKPRTGKHVLSALRCFFSLGHCAHVASAYAYILYESVIWRSKLHRGKHVRVHPTASIRNPQNVWIGSDCTINHNCVIWAGEHSKIVIGSHVMLGPGVQMHATRHGLHLGTPMKHQPREYFDISIGSDVWIGAGTVITPGVTIADGVVVGANAVVTKSISEQNVIVGGVPARVIGRRTGNGPVYEGSAAS